MSLKQHAADVLALLERGSYVHDGATVSIHAAQQACVANSRLYTPVELEGLRAQPAAGPPAVEVRDATTQQAAQELALQGPVCLLNFASARNPGGGFLNGAKAQEEDLCRCSGLYPTLLQHPAYYEVNRRQASLLYTDHAIHSPGVPFFKVRGTGDLLAQPFLASVITAPAPNSAHLQRHPGDREALEQAFERRWQNVLCIAAQAPELYRGERTLLLGAWGCGAFGGDPEVAARTARRALQTHGGGLDRVVFAIPGAGRQSAHNLAVFRAVLG